MEQLVRADIPEVIARYRRETGPTDRYASFDYCYRYFRCSSPDELVRDMEKSCLVVGFYLASWGMFRGSSALLQKSVKHFHPLIEYIAAQDHSVWNVDVDSYDSNNIELLRALYAGVRERIVDEGSWHLTLVTKVLLGVFGSVPAFDNYFGDAFRKIIPGTGFRSFNAKALGCIKRFYDVNAENIDHAAQSILVLDFDTGLPTTLVYPKAKVIDMYGFTLGLEG